MRTYPFTAVVGSDDMALALALCAVSPAIGGVLIRGEKGTAKSTMVRALAALLPVVEVIDGCRFSCEPNDPDPSCPDLSAHGAAAYRRAGRIPKSIELMEVTVNDQRARLGPDHVTTLTSQSNLGDLYYAARRFDDAIRTQEPTARRMEQRLGSDHPATLTCRGNLAASYHAAGRTAEAVALFERVVEAMTTRLGPAHPGTLNHRGNLAMGYTALGRHGEAMAVNRETLAATEAKLGRDHPRALASRNNLAASLLRVGLVAEAAPLLEANLALVRAAFGAAHPNTGGTEAKLLGAYQALGRWPAAERLLREMSEVAGRDPSARINLRQELAEVLRRQEKWAEAVPLWRECLRGRETAGDNSWSLDVVRSRLGVCLATLGRFDEAEPLIVRAYEGLDARRPAVPPGSRSRIADAAEAGVFLYEALGNPREAERWRKRLRDDAFPADPFRR